MSLQRHLVLFESCWFDFLSQSLPCGHVITGKCCRMEQVVISYDYAPCFSQNGIYINPSCYTLSCLSRVLRSIGWISLNTCVLQVPLPPVQPCRKIMVRIPAVSVLTVTRGDPTVLRSPTTHDPSFTQQCSSRAVCRLLRFSVCASSQRRYGMSLWPSWGSFEILSTDLYCSLCYCSISTFADFIPTLL